VSGYTESLQKPVMHANKLCEKNLIKMPGGVGGTPGIDFEHFGLKLGMIIGGKFMKAYKLIFLPSNRGK